MSPSELFTFALKNARAATREIDRLMDAPLGRSETPVDRAYLTCVQAKKLAEAFGIIDSVAELIADELDGLADVLAPEPGPKATPAAFDPNLN